MNIEADFMEFTNIVVGFAELKGKQLSKAAIKLFFNAMEHWTMEDFEAAANVLIRTCAFMPTPKDFEDLRRAQLPTAGEAWEAARRVARSLRTVGGQFVEAGATSGDARIDAAVRGIGGYVAIAMHSTETMHFLEKRFSEHLEEAGDALATREALPHLVAPTIRALPPKSLQAALPAPQGAANESEAA